MFHLAHSGDFDIGSFPSIKMSFVPVGAEAQPAVIELRPSHYLFPYLGSMCVGIIEDDIHEVQIGANVMMDHLLVFHPASGRVGVTRLVARSISLLWSSPRASGTRYSSAKLMVNTAGYT